MIRPAKHILFVSGTLLIVTGCGGNTSRRIAEAGGGQTNVGGQTSSGGSASFGGIAAVGGTTIGGAASTGGNSSIGGLTGSGGNATSAGGTIAIGGAQSTGGTAVNTSSTGGANATGGVTSTGGAVAMGGTRATGGTTSTGGASNPGGTGAAGGSALTGGVSSTGGKSPTGGSSSTGGTRSSGGFVATGGNATGGTTFGNTGGSTNQMATGGAAGNGGQGGVSNACNVPAASAVLIDEPFTSDVFTGNVWARSDGSVTVQNGLLSIVANGNWDDYAECSLTNGNLPIVVEARLRNVSGGGSDWLPVVESHYDTSGNRVAVGFSNASGYGWTIDPSGGPSGSFVDAPTAEGDWITYRIFLRSDGGVLCVKNDTESDFEMVATGSWQIPSTITTVRCRQAWDAVSEVDYIRVLKL